MDKDCYPFFSMLFWCATKLLGLWTLVTGLLNLASVFGHEGWFSRLVWLVALPVAVGFFLLTSDFVYDAGTAVMRGRRGTTTK